MAEKDYVKTVYVDGSEPDVDAVHLNNTEDGLDGLYHPEFDDSGTVEGITSFPTFLSTVVKRMNPIAFYKNFKAGMKYVLHTGSLINNGLCTETGKYAADATQLNPNIANTLAWQVAKVNSDLVVDRGAVTGDFNNYRSPGIYRFNGEPSILNSPGSVAGNLEVIVTTGYVIQRITVYDRTHTRRYNGSVWTDWASYVTGADIQSGIATVNAAANGTTEFTVNFPKPFSKYPEVVMSAVTSRPDLRSAAPLSRDTQKVTGVVYNGTSASELSVFWIAIAK